MPKTVYITNESTACTDAEVQAWIPDLQTQVTRDFCPIWGVDAVLEFSPKGRVAAADDWILHVLDNSDQAGALGYHDDQKGVPVGFVFAADDKRDGNSVSVTVSHELLELLADPFIQSTALYVKRSGWFSQGLLLALEVADACEADQFGYKIGNTLVSDFVTPAWFGAPLPAGGKYSFTGACSKPYQILQGGYIGVLSLRGIGQWGQVTGRHEESGWECHQMQERGLIPFAPPKGSRRERRARQHGDLFTAAMTGRIVGPVRNDIDQLIGHAEQSLSGADNAVNWMATMLAGLASGKTSIRVALEGNPPGFSTWLEPRA